MARLSTIQAIIAMHAERTLAIKIEAVARHRIEEILKRVEIERVSRHVRRSNDESIARIKSDSSN